MKKIQEIVEFLLKLKKGENYFLEAPERTLNYSVVSQKVFALTILNNTIFTQHSFDSQEKGEYILKNYLQKNQGLNRYFQETSIKTLKFFLWNSFRANKAKLRS